MDCYDRRYVCDLSPFFLVELSDDSEVDFDSSNASALVEAAQEDNDDAQSFCNDFSCWGSGSEHEETDTTGRYEYESEDYGRVELPWEDDEDEEEGVVNMSVRRRDSDPNTCIQGIRGSRYQHQPVNETERNKIFWETCLASGY